MRCPFKLHNKHDLLTSFQRMKKVGVDIVDEVTKCEREKCAWFILTGPSGEGACAVRLIAVKNLEASL